MLAGIVTQLAQTGEKVDIIQHRPLQRCLVKAGAGLFHLLFLCSGQCAYWRNSLRDTADRCATTTGLNSSAPRWACSAKPKASSYTVFSQANSPKTPMWSVSTARFAVKCSMPTSSLPCARYATCSSSKCTIITPCFRTRLNSDGIQTSQLTSVLTGSLNGEANTVSPLPDSEK